METVRHALERGVDFIDTSRAYTTSERRIGLALKQAGIAAEGGAPGPAPAAAWSSPPGRTPRRRRPCGPTWRPASRNSSATTSTSTCATSWPTRPTIRRVTSPGGALEALQQSQATKGLIGHIGITSHSLEVLDRALDDGLFDVIMVCFSFLEPKARETVIPKASRQERRRARHEAVLRRGDRGCSAGAQVHARRARGAGARRGGAPRSVRRELEGVPGGRPADRGRAGADRGDPAELRQGVLPPVRLLPALHGRTSPSRRYWASATW